jgi:hypothetical protein
VGEVALRYASAVLRGLFDQGLMRASVRAPRHRHETLETPEVRRSAWPARCPGVVSGVRGGSDGVGAAGGGAVVSVDALIVGKLHAKPQQRTTENKRGPYILVGVL